MTEQNTDVTIFEEMMNKTFSEVAHFSSDERFTEYLNRFGNYKSQYSTMGKTFRYLDSEDYLVFVEADLSAIHIFAHQRECCESVWLEDITGDLNDLIGKPLLMAELVMEDKDDYEKDLYELWSFYKFATLKGNVTLRWIGNSNGYYSIDVNYFHFKKP